jgi:hypothetical protein
MRGSSIAVVIVAIALGTTLAAHGSPARTDGQKKQGPRIDSSEPGVAASTGSLDTRLKSLSVRNARLESAPPIDHASSVRLKFEISNDGDESVEDLELEIALVSPPPDDRASSPPVVVMGPLALRTKVPLMPDHSLSYDIRFKNISLDECSCHPEVEVVDGRFETIP